MMAKPAATKIRLRNKPHDRPPRPDPPLLRHLPPPPPPETRRRRSLRPRPHRRRQQISEDDACESDPDDEEEERGMVKKIRLVVKLPSSHRPAVVSSVSSSSSSPSPSPSPSPASSSSSYVEDSCGEEEEAVKPPRKRRMDVVEPMFSSRSGRYEGRRRNAVGRSSGDGCGSLASSWRGTPMPERKELELLLHKLQKNDIYGAFAEPVDPEELPDYHDVIEHPMDFSTVRKKLARGAYGFFEQFEDDVLLICSNAMQYNAPDTVYFRQACVIQDLARKKFQNVRDNITETNQLTEEKARLNSMEKKTLLNRCTPKTPRKAVVEPLLSDIYSGATVASTSDTRTRLSTVNEIEKSVAVNGHLDSSFSRRGSKKERSVVDNELIGSTSSGAIRKEKSVAVNQILDTSSLVDSKHERSVTVNKIRDTSSSPGERIQEKSAVINRILDASLSPVGRKQEKSVAVNRFLDASSSPVEGKQERSVAINRFLDASSSPVEGKQKRPVAINRFLDAGSSPGERKPEKSVAVNRFRSTSSSLEESNLENSVAVNRLMDTSSSPGESKPDRSVAVSGLLDGSSSLEESKQEKSVAINGLDATSLEERKQEKADDFSAKSSPSKLGRKPAVVDENRRKSYNIIPEQKPTVESNFVLNILEDEPKQLVPVGLDTEHSYARSLAQFAASLGPFAWEIVSKRIEKSLPPGIKFGPGWVGEYEPLPAPFLSSKKQDQQLANSSASFSRTEKNEKVAEMKSKQQLTAPAHKKTPNAVKGTFCDHGGEQKPRPLGVCSTAQSKVNGTFGQKQCSDSSSINSGVNSQVSIQKSFVGTTRVKEESLSEEISERRQEVVHASNSRQEVVHASNSIHPVPRTISHQPKNQAVTFANVSPQNNTSPSSKVRHSSFPELFSRENSHMQTEKDFRAISSQNLNNVPDIVTGGSNNATRPNNSLAFMPSNQTSLNYGFNHGNGNNLDQASNGPFKLATFPGKVGSQQNLSVPIVSQLSKENFSPVTSAARSWMSVGTSAQWKPVDSKISSEKSNISSSFAHPSWRPPQFNGDSANLLLQADAPQVKNRGLVIFPQLIPTDLSKYKNHPHWYCSSPQTPNKKRDNLPPDLNIGYQPPTSPIHPSSNLAMDSQQPDLALQL